MKKYCKRIIALTMALMMMLSLTAQAAGDDLGYVVCNLSPEAGYTLTPLVSEDLTDNGVTENGETVYKQTVRFKLSFIGEANTQYVVFLLSDSATVPTENTIRYIDQVGSDGKGEVIFPVFPDSLKKDGTYNVYITSAVDGKQLAASFLVKKTFTLGDVNQDGNITAYDASLVLQYAAEKTEFSETQKLAADTSRGDGITAYDASLILQYAAEKITGF